MRKIILPLPLAAAAFFVITLPQLVSAHERQVIQIGNKDYLFIVGSLNEPVTIDDKTGVDLRILLADPANPSDSKAAGARPVTGLDQTLKVEVSAADQKRTLDLSPAFGDPGAYRAVFFPTIQTTLTYRFFGMIDNVPINLSFSCNPAGHPQTQDDKSIVTISDNTTRKLKTGAFGCPLAKADLGFPEKSASLYDIQKKVGGLDAQLSDLGSTSRNFTILAIAMALLGLIAGIGAWMGSRKQ